MPFKNYTTAKKIGEHLLDFINYSIHAQVYNFYLWILYLKWLVLEIVFLFLFFNSGLEQWFSILLLINPFENLMQV